MYCLRYWARYVRKGEVKSGGIKIGNEIPRAWISLKRASAAPQSKKLCCVIPFFILIIFKSIIQFLVMLFPLLLWLHQQNLPALFASLPLTHWINFGPSSFPPCLTHCKIFKFSTLFVTSLYPWFMSKLKLFWLNHHPGQYHGLGQLYYIIRSKVFDISQYINFPPPLLWLLYNIKSK